MEPKKIKKLTIKQEVISNLSQNEKNQLRAGGQPTPGQVFTNIFNVSCQTCNDNTCWEHGASCTGAANYCGGGSDASECNCTDSNMILCTNYGATGYAGCLNWTQTQGFLCLY